MTLDGLGGKSVRTEPTSQETNSVTGEADAAPADVGQLQYRKHASREVLSHPDYSKHISAMTIEELHSKAEIAEELAVRDIRITELEAQLAAVTQDWRMENDI